MMRPITNRLSRLPLRIRLVGGFSAAMFVVLVAAGAFVYWRVAYALDRELRSDLTEATHTLDPLVGRDGVIVNRSVADATGVAWQVLDQHAAVLDRGGPATLIGMVRAPQLSKVGDRGLTFDVGDFLPASPKPYRLRVTRTPASPDHYLVVAVRRDHRDEALRELLVQLSLAGLGALLITALVGDRLAHAALQPVERYRRRAADIADGAADLRLDVPTDRDDEVTRLGHTFNDMLATLDRALERERQFVNEASHELRTPITLLTSRVQLARRRRRSVEQHERVLSELEVDLNRLAELAEQLLQLGAADVADPHATSDLAAVVDRIASPPHSTRNSPASYVSVTRHAPDTSVRVGELAAERIVTNLIDNARRHGAPPIRVDVDRPASDWTRLVVVDAGPGMSAELLAVATQRFTRAEEARSRPGAGLGLALVEELVRRAGGELRLCHGEEHSSHGRAIDVACTHGPEMTVTVLLPAGLAAGKVQ